MKEQIAVAIAILGLGGFFFYQHQQSQIARRPSYEGSETVIAKPIQDQNSLSCQVDRVSDGDTIAVNCDGQKLKIRFCGIDAPESKQPLGKESKDLMEKLVNTNGGKVIVYPVEKDRYGRTVAEVEVFTGKKTDKGDRINLFVNAEMVRAGLAYHYAQYSGNCPNKEVIVNSEDEAKGKKIGVWSGNYQKPWHYRKSKR